MAKIYIKYDFTSIASPYIILVCTEHSAPLAEVDRIVLASGAYDGGDTFTDLNPVMHRIRYYQSTDGTTLGSLIGGLSIDATIYNEPGAEIITFEVGAGRGAPHYDPAPGVKVYSNPAMDGNVFTVSQEGYGLLNPDDAVINPKDYEPYAGGGFEFTTDKEFAEGERYVIVNFLTVSVAAQNVLSRPYEDLIELDADITFAIAYYNHFIRTDFAGSVGTITFPAHASVPNYTRLKLSTHGGNQNYLVLQFNGSETVKHFGEDLNTIYLAKGEEMELQWKGGVCFVVDYKGNYLNRGHVKMSYDNPTGKPFLYAHVDTGVLNKSDYPGLYEYIANLPVGVVITNLTTWNTSASVNGKTKYPNRSRYGIDTIAETFRVPHLANLGVRFLKADVSTDTERVNDIPGGYQDDMYLAHDHDYKRPRTDTVGTQYEANRMRSDNSRGLWTGDTVQTEESGGTETRMENFGQIPLIYL
jgi:hypothetical protein